MPSRFPGMDPYIEDPEIWSDFHGRLAEEISAALNQVLKPRYVARLTPRDDAPRALVDVVINHRCGTYDWADFFDPHFAGPADHNPEGIARTLRLYTVEVRETGGLRLVTAIEVLSPVNKRPGHEAYHDYLRSGASCCVAMRT